MADSIVGGLFGTPEEYQAQRDRQILQESIQLAKLDPFEAAKTGIGYGAYKLAGALGGQDPQLQLLSQRNAVIREVNPNDPESIMAGAQRLAPFDPVGASAMANQAREASLKLSQVTRNLRERQGLDPVQQIIRSGKYTPESIAEYEKTNDITRLQLVEKPEKSARFGIDREALSEEKFNMPFASLSQDQKAVINRLIEEQKASVADKSGVKVYPPGTPVAQKDWMDFRKFVDTNSIMKKTSSLISEAPNAFETINRITSNDIAAKALPSTLARLTGETGPLSKADVARFARTGGLDDRLAQAASEFLSGRGTSQQKDQAQKFVSAIYRGALLEQKNFVMDEARQLGYTNTPNYESFIKSIDDKLSKFKEFTPSSKTSGESPPAQPSVQTGFKARRIN